MSAYLISRSGVESLDTVIFSAGPDEKEEAIAVFTDPKLAEQYVEAAGWSDDHTVATLEPIPFLRWMLEAHAEGVNVLVVDPDFEEQQSGQKLNTLDIEAHLEHAAMHVLEVARPDF